MIEISLKQKDLIQEAVNIGFGRAASSLSILLGEKIILHAPSLHILNHEELLKETSNFINGKAIFIHQKFLGKLQGDVHLIMEENSGVKLIDLISGEQSSPRRINSSDREALMEVGNILLNAYVGTFGNMLNVSIKFSIPNLSIIQIPHMLSKHFTNYSHNISLLVKTEFQLLDHSIDGYVLLVLSESSLKIFLQNLEEELS